MRANYDHDKNWENVIRQKREYLLKLWNEYGHEICNILKEDFEENEIDKIADFLAGKERSGTPKKKLNPDRIKFILSLPYISDDLMEVVTNYIMGNTCGWQDNKYIFSNRCFHNRPESHCKALKIIPYDDIQDWVSFLSIFAFWGEYSHIAVLIFSYCISSLFASVLNRDHITPPLYLQIVCEKDSSVYELIEELVNICDVNAKPHGESCSLIQNYGGYCHSSTHIFYPSLPLSDQIHELVRDNRDSPVIISGFGNRKSYKAMMREIVNIAGKNRGFTVRDRMNTIPLFVSDTPVLDFDNVMCLDLTESVIDECYMDMIKQNGWMLSKIVFGLVNNFTEYFFQDAISKSDRDYRIEQLLAKRTHISLNAKIAAQVKVVDQEFPNLPPKTVDNVGFLSYFLVLLFRTWDELAAVPDNTLENRYNYISFNRQKQCIAIKGFSPTIIEDMRKSLVAVHRRFSPKRIVTEITDRQALALSRKISRIYRELGVYIQAVPTEVKEDRYIFTIQTVQATKDSAVKANAETVQRRLKDYEYFRVILKPGKPITLIAAKKVPQDNNLREIFATPAFQNKKMKIPYAIGFDDKGDPYVEDLAEFPHLLILGETNSGKSTAIRNLLMSIAKQYKSEKVNVIIMDFLGKEQSDYSMFDGLPFMSAPIITSSMQGRAAIDQLYHELDKNSVAQGTDIVCIIDEFPSFFTSMNSKKEKEDYRTKLSALLSKGRHSNIHIVLASQTLNKRDIMIDTINFPSRMIFRFPSVKISETILGRRGAEKLRGKGDMIFISPYTDERRLQGAFMPEDDMRNFLEHIRKDPQQPKEPVFALNMDSNEYQDAVLLSETDHRFVEVDDVLPQAIALALKQRRISNLALTEQYQIGYKKAKEILKKMSDMGFIRRLNGNHGWIVIPERVEDIPADVVELMEQHGYTLDEIQKSMNEHQ